MDINMHFMQLDNFEYVLDSLDIGDFACDDYEFADLADRYAVHAAKI